MSMKLSTYKCIVCSGTYHGTSLYIGEWGPFCRNCETKPATRVAAQVTDQIGRIAELEAALEAAKADTERLDKLERQVGPVKLCGDHQQWNGSYQTWRWVDVHGRETFRHKTVREAIDDIKEIR